MAVAEPGQERFVLQARSSGKLGEPGRALDEELVAGLRAARRKAEGKATAFGYTVWVLDRARGERCIAIAFPRSRF